MTQIDKADEEYMQAVECAIAAVSSALAMQYQQRNGNYPNPLLFAQGAGRYFANASDAWEELGDGFTKSEYNEVVAVNARLPGLRGFSPTKN